MRKALSFILTLAMLLSLSVTAFADTTTEVTPGSIVASSEDSNLTGATAQVTSWKNYKVSGTTENAMVSHQGMSTLLGLPDNYGDLDNQKYFIAYFSVDEIKKLPYSGSNCADLTLTASDEVKVNLSEWLLLEAGQNSMNLMFPIPVNKDYVNMDSSGLYKASDTITSSGVTYTLGHTTSGNNYTSGWYVGVAFPKDSMPGRDLTISVALSYEGTVAATRSYTFKAEVAEKAAKIGETEYATLSEAITAAGENSTGTEIQLLRDVALESAVEINKSLTLNLNEFNITSENGRALWIKSGDVSITGTGTITAGTESSTFGTGSSVIRVGDKDANNTAAKLTIGKDVTVTSPYCYGITVFGVNCGTSAVGQELVVNGKVIVSGVEAAISGNGTSTLSQTTITINEGAEVSATQDYAIYHPQKGTLTVNGGEITGLGGIEAKGGTVEVKGGTITATATTTSHSGNNNGTSTSGYALASVENSNYKGDGDIIITGGTINGAITADQVDSSASWDNTITASGGTFSVKPASAYIADGYAAAENADGTYTIKAAKVEKTADDKYTVTLGDTQTEAKTATVTVEETTVSGTGTEPAAIVGATVKAENIKETELSKVIATAVLAASENSRSEDDPNKVKLSMFVEDQTQELKSTSSVVLSSVEQKATTENDAVFEVHPVATVYTSNDVILGSSKVENDQLAENASFQVTIPVPGSISGNKVKVTHYYDDGTVDSELNAREFNVTAIGGKRYVTVTMKKFSLIGMTGEGGVSPFSAELQLTGTTHTDGKQENAKTVSGYYAVKTGTTVTADLILKNTSSDAVTVGASTFWLDLDPSLSYSNATLSSELTDWMLDTNDASDKGKLAFTLGGNSEASAKTIAAGGTLKMAKITLTVGNVTVGRDEQLLDIGLSAMELQKNGVHDVGGKWTGAQVVVPQERMLSVNMTSISNGSTTSEKEEIKFSLLDPKRITVPSAPVGYSFECWNLSKGANTTWTDGLSLNGDYYRLNSLVDTSGRDGDATITTHWTPKTYTMNFNTQVQDENGDPVKAFGAENNAAISAIDNVTYTIKDTKTIDNPTESVPDALTGYQVTGWKVTVVDSTGTNWTVNEQMNLATEDATSITMPAHKYGDVTLTAVYTPIEYTVTLPEIAGVTYTKGGNTVSGTSTFNIRDGVTITATKAGSTFAYWKASDPDTQSNWATNAKYADPASDGIVSTKGKYGNVTLTPAFILDAQVEISGFAYAGTGNYLMGVLVDSPIGGATYNYNGTALYLDSGDVYKTALFGADATGTAYVTIINGSELETDPVTNKLSKLADATKLGYTAGTTSGNVALNTGTVGDVNGNGSVTTADYGAANDLFRISDHLTPAFAESNYTGLSVLGRLMADATHTGDGTANRFGSIDDIVAIIRLVQNPG